MATSVDAPGTSPQLPPLLTPQNIIADYMNEINPIMGCLALAKDMRGERSLEEVFYELLAQTVERAGGGIIQRFSAHVHSKYPEYAEVIFAQQDPDMMIACDQIADAVNIYYVNRTLTPELCEKFEKELRAVLAGQTMPGWLVTLRRARQDYDNNMVNLKVTAESASEEALVFGRSEEAILQELLDKIARKNGTIVKRFTEYFPIEKYPMLARYTPPEWLAEADRIIDEVRRLYAAGTLKKENIQILSRALFDLTKKFN